MKVFEKLFLNRMKLLLEELEDQSIAEERMSFEEIISPSSRVIDNIYNTFEEGKYCSPTFLDITMAFDKV